MATEYSPEHPDSDVMAELLLALAEQDDAYEKRSTVVCTQMQMGLYNYI